MTLRNLSEAPIQSLQMASTKFKLLNICMSPILYNINIHMDNTCTDRNIKLFSYLQRYTV